MKVFKILLGTLFGAWAIASLVGGLRERGAMLDLSPRGLSEIGALVAAVGMLTVFSLWSFQSAFRKPAPAPQEDRSQTDAT